MAKTKAQDIAIIGLGSFGANLLDNFYRNGVDVTIIDKDPSLVNKYASKSSNALVADTTNGDVLKNLGLNNYDCVIVAIGQDLNASILTTLILLEFEIDEIIVKASDLNHVKILSKIGAHRIIYPDSEMGKRVAMQVMHHSLIELIEINEEQTMAQVAINNPNFIGKDLATLDFTNKYGVIIAAIRRNGENTTPSAAFILEENDVIIIVGQPANVEAFAKVI